jgi:hypothetical protein
MSKNTQIIELTPNGHNEHWWLHMEQFYKQYGLDYKRFYVNVIENNLYLTDLICRNIFNLLKIKYFDNFISIGERCDNTISLYNINYKNGSYPFDYIISNLKRINEIYLKSGRFLAKIDPKIIQKEQNRVEIIFEIFEGQKAKISDIYFVGNINFSDQDLLDEISTKKWTLMTV